ncbi:FlgL Flagellin and related hook-associated proteins [Rhabdaerophilaceae bacterium]
MTILFNDATNASIAILQRSNELFQVTQRRVSTGKRVFTSADDASRYRGSETLLSRSRQLLDVNSNISLALSTLESTQRTLENMHGLVESAMLLVRRAEAESSSGQRSALSTANLDENSVVTGAVVGSRFSITTDDGRNFNYVFSSATTTWGQIAGSLNASNIGIVAQFVPSSVAGETNLRFTSNSQLDFSFDAVSDQAVMDDLAGLSTPTGQIFNANNLFANGIAAPAAGETGMLIGYGGQFTGNAGGGVTAATVIPGGSGLSFIDGNGNFRSLNYAVGTPVSQLISDITAMGAGIKAELVNQSGGAGGPLQLRLRNMRGNNMEIVSATGAFASGGLLGLNGVTVGYAPQLASNNALRLSYGQQYDDIIRNIDQVVVNNPSPKGRNLLKGDNMNVMMDEFSGNPLAIAGISITAATTLTMSQQGATWTSDQNIQTSAQQALTALDTIRGIQAQFATFMNYIRERFELNRQQSSDLKTSGDELVAADVTEESAALVALQTRQEFAVQAITIGNQVDQSLLRLLG